jgi:predicted peptidase
MNLLVAIAAAGLLAQGAPTTAGVHELTFQVPGEGIMLYAVSIPKGYDARRPAPLVLVLHSGGERMKYYGSAFMRLLVEPALDNLGPIMIAPDCPTAAWTDPAAERAVMALLRDTIDHYAIDRRRILVTGFSLGGRGAWFMASRHADLFTAAIPMAASTGDEPIERLGTIPTYIIHSRADEVSPFAPAERTARQLAGMGRPVRFEALSGFGHYEMYRYVDALRRAGRWVADQWAKAAPTTAPR